MSANPALPISTTEDVAGRAGARHLGLVLGVDVRATAVGTVSDTTATRNGAEHVAAAVAQMVEHAVALGADAVVGVRLETTNLGEDNVQVLAYGSAVTLANVM